MIPLPDLSFFAIPSFIENLSHRNRSSSIILHNRQEDYWDAEFSESDLMSWLHNTSNIKHDIYLTYNFNIKFIENNFNYCKEIFSPAFDRIRVFLKELDIEEVDEYLKYSKDWLYAIYCGKPQAHRAAEIAARGFGIDPNNLPSIVVWSNFNARSIIKILPHQNYSNTNEYLKYIYNLIIKSTDVEKISTELLLTEIKNNMNEDAQRQISRGEELRIKNSNNTNLFNINKNFNPVRSISISYLEKSVIDILIDAAQEYSSSFNDAILNFECDTLKIVSSDNKSIFKFMERSKSEIVKMLSSIGCYKLREGGSHEIWQHPSLSTQIPVPRHNRISAGVSMSIERYIHAAILGR